MGGKRIREVLRFAVAGVAGFAVELLVLILLKEKLGIDTLIATPIAFLLSVIVNYVICVFWVFDGARDQSRKSQAGFLLTSVIGLLLNELLMFLFRVMWGGGNGAVHGLLLHGEFICAEQGDRDDSRDDLELLYETEDSDHGERGG